jgi:hypothetical protein
MGAVRPGHEVAGGRRTVSGVRGGNCLADTDVVRMSVSPMYGGVCNQGSSCPTGGSVSVKGNRP